MQKPLKKILITLGFFSLLISTGLTVWLYNFIYPYDLIEESEMTTSLGGRIDFFRDIDDDGFSERFVFYSNKVRKSYNLKIYRQQTLRSTSIIDQYNFQNPITKQEIYFQDITGDSSEEVFVFSKNDTGLYLTVIDPKRNEYIYKERFLLHGPVPNPHVTWDLSVHSAVFSDINEDGTKEIIFTLHSGHSQKPRGLYVLDITNWQLLHQIKYNAGSTRVIAYDLTGDGKVEFIVTSAATDNIREDDNYTDKKSWLMVFDRQFRFLFKPKAMGGRFTTTTALPFRYKGQNMFVVLVFNNPPIKALLINQNGTVVKELTIPGPSPFLIYNQAVKNGIYLFPGRKEGKIRIIDSLLTLKKEIVAQDDAPPVQIFDLINLNNQGYHGLLGFCAKGLFVKSLDLKTVALFPWSNEIVRFHSHCYLGKNTIPYLSIITLDRAYFFRIQPNPYYPYLSFTFFLIAALMYIILFLLHLGINKVRIYAAYLLFSLRGSDNAIILLDHRGKIITFNKKVNDLLKLTSSIRAREHFTDALRSRPQIAEIIDRALQSGQQLKNEYSFEEAKDSFIGEVIVTPFKSYFEFINAVLVEIKDSTRQVLFERQQNWQRNIRKMVHDIKNPLAGVQLKLQTLYLKLIDSNPDLPSDIKEEFEQAYSELKRIRNISKNFLKFSDLELLQPETLNLQNLCETCLDHFKLFENKQLKIQIHMDKSLPEEVFWDRRQIELLIHILLENAIDAVNGKGTIDITIKPSAQVLSTKSPYVEFRIADDGPGIPETIRPKIFKPHFSTKKEGSGMGLVFAKQIVSQHGGSIQFFTADNSGTVFVVILPVFYSSFS